MRKAIILGLFLLTCLVATAQSYKQHPLFIYSFTRYIQWPEAYNQGDFEILVLGETPLLNELQSMAKNKKIGDRIIIITKINTSSEIRKCNMLFLPVEQSSKYNEVLQKIGAQSILVMTEQPGLGSQGSCINFITKDGKLAFELNQSALTKQNLKASSEITRLAIMI